MRSEHERSRQTGDGRGTDEDRDRLQIEAFIRGEMSGFTFVYNRFQQQVYSYCFYFTGDKVAAEDAFQEVFTRVYTHREQLREPKALKSWLLLITRSVCLNLGRTSKFMPEFVPIGPDSDDDDYVEPKELSFDPREIGNSGDLLQFALSKLPPIHREAFLMREIEGYPYEEIAAIAGTNVMNVKVRIMRAKKRLRIILGPHFEEQRSAQKKRKGPRKGKGLTGQNFDGVSEDEASGEDIDARVTTMRTVPDDEPDEQEED